MKKTKNTIHLSGINILLQLLMYDEYYKYKFKYYLITNKYEEKKNKIKYFKKLEYQKKIISILKKKFNLNIIILEDCIETNIFLKDQNKKVQFLTNEEIVVDNNDLVSNNLFNYLKKKMKGKNISFISEGFGIFNLGKKKSLISMLKIKLIIFLKFCLSKFSLSYFPKEIIIFSDRNEWFTKYFNSFYLPYNKIVLKKNKINEKFINKYFEIFSNLSDDFLNFYNKEYKIFHPVLKRLTANETSKLLIKILSITDGKILVKQHPSDYRDFSFLKYISKRIIILSDELKLFPGELFLKKETIYYGELSSLVLSIEENKLYHIAPQNIKYKNWAESTLYNFKELINKNL
jgi:hypothetical protein